VLNKNHVGISVRSRYLFKCVLMLAYKNVLVVNKILASLKLGVVAN